MNTDQIIEDDIREIEAVRAPLAAELGLPENSKAVQCGVDCLARGIVEDLRSLLTDYEEAASYVGVRDSLNARIRAIKRKYDLR
jgi:hypothetical protein